MTRLQWGILGPGRIAPRVARALAANPRGGLLAVASRELDRARDFAAANGAAVAYGSYEALLADGRIDVVYIALPNHLHATWTIRALEAGKHVLCEKPICLTVAEVDAVAAAAAANGRIAVEAFMYLHHPQIVRALDIAGSGELGQVQVLAGAFSFRLEHPADPRIDPAMGGGSLWDVGCYPVSFARRLAGREPTAIAGLARFDDHGVDRAFVGQLAFPGGLLAHFESGFGAPDRERLEIVGSAATLVLDHPFLPAPDGPPPSLALWRNGRASAIPVDAPDQYRLEVDDLQSAILEGSQPRVDLAFSRGSIATLVELDRTARAADDRAADRDA